MQDPAPRETVQPRFAILAGKTVVCHTLTYFFMGMLAFHFLRYADFINKPNSGMLCYWVNHAGKRSMSWVLSAVYAVCVALPLLGLLAPKR
jgi:hypothetical protein